MASPAPKRSDQAHARLERIERRLDVLEGVLIGILVDMAQANPSTLASVQRDIYRIREALRP